jgi:hypothetical protein
LFDFRLLQQYRPLSDGTVPDQKQGATNQGLSHNAGRAVGALFPGLIGYLSQSMGVRTAIGVFTIVAYLLLLTALSLLPETHGRDLAVMSKPVRA